MGIMMSKKCMKCGYVRQDSDSAPDYECPKCGVVYAKAEAAVKRQTAITESEDESSVEKLSSKFSLTMMAVILIAICGVTYGGYSYYKAAQTKKALELAKIADEKAKADIQRKDKETQDAINRQLLSSVTSQLIDPGSSQLRNVQYFTGMATLKDGRRERASQTICGEINAKNSFGGYVGFRRFYSVAMIEYNGNVIIMTKIEDPSDDETQRLRFERSLKGCRNTGDDSE